jgi:restriction endonuclease S subunit
MSKAKTAITSEVTDQFEGYDKRKSGPEWIEAIPEHWNEVRLRYLLDVTPSKNEVRNREEEMEVSFVPMEAIQAGGGLDLGATKEIVEVIDGYTYFRNGDVVVAKITPCFENGKGALAKGLTNEIGFGTTELHVLRPKEGLDRRYLFYLTMSHPFRKMGEATMYGAGGQKRVPDDFIRNLRWPTPPLDEQRAIAAYLDRETERIDTLIKKKERLIDLLEEKRTALISRVVTKGLDDDAEMKDSRVDWLGKIPTDWEIVPFRYYCNIPKGQVDPERGEYQSRILISPNHVEQNSGNIRELETADEQGASSGKYPVEPGDLIYSKIRPELNKICIAKGHWLCSADMYPIKIRTGFDARYLKYLMLSRQFVRIMVADSMRVAMPKVNRETLGAVRVVKPPLNEQRTIANHLNERISRIDELIGEVRRAINRLEEYRTALISAAVIGKIDVRAEATAVGA